MEPDLNALDDYLAAADLDGYLLRASGDDPDQRYITGFPAPDPFVTVYTAGEIHLLVRGLDRGLAEKTSRADTVWTAEDFDQHALREKYGPAEAEQRVLTSFLDEHDVAAVGVPSGLSVGVADGMRDRGVSVTIDHEGVIEGIRAVKTPEELAMIEATQRATQRAMARAAELIGAAVAEGGQLTHESAPLTSERVKEEIELSLRRQGCITEETIVAGGADAANPHDRGSGPLAPNEPIVIDIFPHDRETKYCADMTRTVCVGEPSDAAAEAFSLTKRAKDAAIEAIEPGVTGEAVHDAVCDVYEEAGVTTLRTDRRAETGFIHGTGHGVGLAVHESPRVSTGGGELEPGHVVTVEPGVYDPEFGGVRLEDLVRVTDDGAEVLTDFETKFVL